MATCTDPIQPTSHVLVPDAGDGRTPMALPWSRKGTSGNAEARGRIVRPTHHIPNGGASAMLQRLLQRSTKERSTLAQEKKAVFPSSLSHETARLHGTTQRRCWAHAQPSYSHAVEKPGRAQPCSPQESITQPNGSASRATFRNSKSYSQQTTTHASKRLFPLACDPWYQALRDRLPLHPCGRLHEWRTRSHAR